MADEAELSDYVRVKRRNTTIFLYVVMSDTASDVRAKISAVNKVPASDMRLFLDKNGEIPLDEKKSLADQKARLPPRAPAHPHRPPVSLAGSAACPPARAGGAAVRARCSSAHGRWRTTRSYSWSSEKKVRAKQLEKPPAAPTRPSRSMQWD
jgi:hypothetical protein